MPLDLDGLADLVVLTVKNAIAPLRQELALVQQDNANLRAQLAGVGELRDRVVVVETKSAMPLPMPVVTEVPPVDLSPLLARISAIEQAHADTKQALAVVTELRDRVVVVETKQQSEPVTNIALPPIKALDSTEVMQCVAPLFEALKSDIAQGRERLAVIETKATPPTVTDNDVNLAIRERLDPLNASITDVRERLSALEARAPIPGPPGRDGENGTPGQNGQDGTPGRDGADGLGFDDLSVEQDGRTLVLKFQRGSQVKTWPIQLPFLQYEGVYIEGKSYEQGAVVTWAGSTWHANEQTTTKPGDGSRAWTLIVKKGRDGKDGRDALEPTPVVSVRR